MRRLRAVAITSRSQRRAFSMVFCALMSSGL
jgi:hypothetical protein